jgi:hypothetical protein
MAHHSFNSGDTILNFVLPSGRSVAIKYGVLGIYTMTAQLKTIASFRDLPLAELAKAKIESEGIPCSLANAYHVGVNWLYSFALGRVKLQVYSPDAEKAKQILHEDHSDDLNSIEDEFPKPDVSDYSQKCSSRHLSIIRDSCKSGALSLLTGFPLVFFRKRYTCADCGHIMKSGRK